MSEETPELLDLPPQNDLIKPVAKREGWLIDLPGYILMAGHPLWSDAQRQGKVTIEGVFLTAGEEKTIALSAAAEPGSAGLRQVIGTIYAVDGKKVAHLDRPDVWAALGARGRALYAKFYQQAYSIDDEELAEIGKSFRLSSG